MPAPRYGDPCLLTKRELAHHLHVTVQTIWNWQHAGHIPAIYHPLGPGPGRRVYFHLPDVITALQTSGKSTPAR